MNSSTSLSSTPTSKLSNTNSNNKENDVITLTEKIKLRKDQYEVLIICDIYHSSLSEYIQEALVEAMKFDIEEDNFCDTLLKIDDGDNKENNSPFSSNPMNSDLYMLKKLQPQIS